MNQYQVIGRRTPKPEAAEEKPVLYRMMIFAPSELVAKSRFWYFLSKMRKLKKANGEIVAINKVRGFFFVDLKSSVLKGN